MMVRAQPMPPLDLIGPEVRDTLHEIAEPLRLSRGRAVYLSGDEAVDVFLVVEGKVKITRRSRRSPDPAHLVGRDAWSASSSGIRESLLWLMGPGDLFGERALSAGHRHGEQATCVSTTRLLRLPATEFIEAMAATPSLALAVTQYLAERLHRADDQTSGLALGTVPSRLAAALVHLSERFGTQTAAGLRVQHDLTQSELAQIVGASRETVNKTLTEFATRGWISVGPRFVVITDLDKLANRMD